MQGEPELDFLYNTTADARVMSFVQVVVGMLLIVLSISVFSRRQNTKRTMEAELTLAGIELSSLTKFAHQIGGHSGGKQGIYYAVIEA